MQLSLVVYVAEKKHDEHHEKGGIYERMTYYDE